MDYLSSPMVTLLPSSSSQEERTAGTAVPVVLARSAEGRTPVYVVLVLAVAPVLSGVATDGAGIQVRWHVSVTQAACFMHDDPPSAVEGSLDGIVVGSAPTQVLGLGSGSSRSQILDQAFNTGRNQVDGSTVGHGSIHQIDFTQLRSQGRHCRQRAPMIELEVAANCVIARSRPTRQHSDIT